MGKKKRKMGNVCSSDDRVDYVDLNDLPYGVVKVGRMNAVTPKVEAMLRIMETNNGQYFVQAKAGSNTNNQNNTQNHNNQAHNGQATNTHGQAQTEKPTLTKTMKDSPILKYPNGDTYRGQFRGTKREGEGELITAKGDLYRGRFFKNN